MSETTTEITAKASAIDRHFVFTEKLFILLAIRRHNVQQKHNALVKGAVRRAALSDKMAAGHPKALCGEALPLN